MSGTSGPRTEAELQGILRDLAANPGLEVTDEAFPASLARLALEVACDLVCVHDRDGVYLYLSPAGLAPFGHRPVDAVGHHPAEYVHPEDRERFLAELPPAVRGNGKPVRYRVRCGDGSYRRVESLLQAVRVDGRARLVLSTTRDVQGIHDAAVQEREHAEGLAALGALAAGAAHEINNPLTWILANLGDALERLDAAGANAPADAPADARALAELRELVSEARDGVVRVGTLAKEMKHFGRRHAVGHDIVDLRHALDAAVALVSNQLRHRASLTKDYGTPPRVVVNDARLGQVFVNLLLNAVQALPDETGSTNLIRIVTGTTATGEAFAEIIDNGPGIDPEVEPRIFDPFFTTKAEGVGTGLGLSVCRGIVEEAGGVIEVESRLGVGTCFRVRLPAASEDETVEPTPAPVPPPARAPATETTVAASAPRLRILVVDDEPLIGAVIRRMLRGVHDVTFHARAADALAELTDGARYDLVLCDLMMPEMTGMDLHDAVVDLDPALAERMWFLSGGAFTDRARAFLESVEDRHLAKPFDREALEAVIARFAPD